MGYTFVEKALARNAGLSAARAGQVIDIYPDLVLSHDNTAAIVRIFHEIGVKQVKYPQRLAVTLDHAAPAPTTQHAQNHAEIRRFVVEQGIPHFFEVGRGISSWAPTATARIMARWALLEPGLGAAR
jgi:homoaconitase/3-isopropylmalate dehydratase large subunit